PGDPRLIDPLRAAVHLRDGRIERPSLAPQLQKRAMDSGALGTPNDVIHQSDAIGIRQLAAGEPLPRALVRMIAGRCCGPRGTIRRVQRGIVCVWHRESQLTSPYLTKSGSRAGLLTVSKSPRMCLSMGKWLASIFSISVAHSPRRSPRPQFERVQTGVFVRTA